MKKTTLTACIWSQALNQNLSANNVNLGGVFLDKHTRLAGTFSMSTTNRPAVCIKRTAGYFVTPI